MAGLVPAIVMKVPTAKWLPPMQLTSRLPDYCAKVCFSAAMEPKAWAKEF